MRKYLMTGVAALAICAAFTSCSKSEELYDAGQIAKNEAAQIEENYNRAFIATFGQPAANQDWGFGSSSRAFTRTISAKNGDAYDVFPSAADVAAYFPTAIPGDADEVSDLLDLYKETKVQTQYGEQTLWDIYAIYAYKIVEGYNLKVTSEGIYTNNVVELGGSFQNASYDQEAGKELAHPYNVYVNVDGNLTIRRVGATHFNLYILKGNVTLESNYGEQAGLISVAEGATLNDQRNSIAANQGVAIYNRGTINATNTEKYDIGNFCKVYNEGKFDVKGALTYSPGDANNSYFMNLGDNAELTAPSMTLNSTGNFFNSGKARIAGETKCTQARLYWVNDGFYETGTMTFSAKNTTFYNYCQLIVKGNAHMYDGEFNLMENSYTEAGTAEFDNFIVNMGSNTGMHVKGTVNFEAQGDGTYQGFRTEGSNDYVLIDGKVTVASHKNTFSISSGITYSIKQIEIVRSGVVVTEAQLQEEGSGDYPVLDLKGTECPYGKLTVIPNTNSCGATWKKEDDPEWDIRIIAEDLNAEAYDSNATDDWTVGSDWDFNDVVFDVKFTSATTADVKIVGAGGVYPLYVAGHEAHEALGQSGTDSNGLYKIQNSGNSAPFPVTGIDRDKNGSDIVVTVVRKSSTGEDIISELKAPFGKPAAKIGVNPKFEPCTEREDIRKRYPLFSKWVQEGGSMAWYNVE